MSDRKVKGNPKVRGYNIECGWVVRRLNVHSPSHLCYSFRSKIIPATNALQGYAKGVAAF